jgi:predicted Rossmann fold flavoprotein
LGVEIRTGCRVTAVTAPREGAADFTITQEHGAFDAARIVLATGGRSLPKTGSDGSGWALARQLGHTVTDTHAALVPLVLDNNKFFHANLSGLSQIVELSTFAGGKRIDRRTGSLLWTHFGISGPVVMDASRHWVIASESGAATPVEMRCNFVPGETFETIEKWLVQTAAVKPRSAIGTIVGERVPQRVAEAMLAHIDLAAATPLAQLTRDARRTLVHALTALSLPVVAHRGWNYAEVTAGGVPLSEIDYRTMQSRKAHKLYLTGEILDCDGRIGGFNFQWAWATGFLAGRAAGIANAMENPCTS